MPKTKPKSLSLANNLRSALLGRDVERRAELGRLTRPDGASRGRNDPLPTLELVYRRPGDLKMPKRNVRVVQPSHVKSVAKALAGLGFRSPVVIEPDGSIIDGVIRTHAAISLGLPEIPCVVAEPGTAGEKRLLRLALNRLAEKGAWDVEALRIELSELVLDEAAIDLTGFETFEVDGLLAAEPQLLEQGRVEPELGPAIAREGDVFQLGPHRVACGDARHAAVLERLMAGASARLVLTDIPFNVPIAGHVTKGSHREFGMASGEMSDEEFIAFNDAWITQAAGHLIDGGLLGTFIDWRGLPSVTVAALAAGLEQMNLIVWSKSNAGMGSLYRSQHELLPLFKKGTAVHVNNVELGKKGRWRSNVWTYPGASTIGSDARRGLKDHPTVKPAIMLADAMLDLTHADEVVLDPFLGSGSTLIAAERSRRACYGVELDPLYVDVALRRYRDEFGREPILQETGETFSALEARRRGDPAPDQIREENSPAAPATARRRMRPVAA